MIYFVRCMVTNIGLNQLKDTTDPSDFIPKFLYSDTSDPSDHIPKVLSFDISTEIVLSVKTIWSNDQK